VSCDSINVTVSVGYKVVPLLRRVLRASLQRDPGVEGADQSRPYANAGLVQCFRLSSVVGRGNVLYRDIYGPNVLPILYR